MALLPNQVATLADLRTQMDSRGDIQAAIDLLSQTNEVLDDMLFVEANEGMTHKTTVRTGLPQAYWRMFNQGVPRAKSTTAQITAGCAQLEVYSEVDEALARLNGNSASWRMGEDQAFVEGMSQQMATTFFYGSLLSNPASFPGVASHYPTVQTAVAANAANVLDAGGTGSTNTSIWLCTWGQNTMHGIYPKGSMAGLQVRDVTTPAPILDQQGNLLQAQRTHFKWDCGLAIRDWRYQVRIANVDVPTLATANPANLLALMAMALSRLPTAPRGVTAVQAATKASGIAPVPMRSVFYVNRTARAALEQQVVNKSNTLLRLAEYDGMVVLEYRGIPIRTVDAILNTEARVV